MLPSSNAHIFELEKLHQVETINICCRVINLTLDAI